MACRKDEPVYEETNLVVPFKPVPFDSTFGLVLFPNPASDTLHIGFVLTTDRNISWTIYDLSGNARSGFTPVTFEKGKHQLNIPLVNLPSGLYFLFIDFGEIRQIRRIIKT